MSSEKIMYFWFYQIASRFVLAESYAVREGFLSFLL